MRFRTRFAHGRAAIIGAQIRQGFDRRPLALDDPVRVPIHRQRDRRVPGQVLDRVRVRARVRRVGHERVPQRVEVRDPALLVLASEPSRDQIRADHAGAVGAVRHRERQGARMLARQVRGQILGQPLADHEHRRLSVLGALGSARHRRGARV
ncbi:MAG: hypothetical protein VW405_00310 [Rhodospirillaceae bacterium]